MDKWLTKKNVLIFFGVSAIFVLFLDALADSGYCSAQRLSCRSTERFLLPLAWSGFPLSLLLLFLRDEIFRSWLRFLAWWLPVGYFLSYSLRYSAGYISFELFNTRLMSFVILSFSPLLFAIKIWELRRIEAGNPIALWLKWASFVFAFALSIVLSGYIYGLIW